MSAPLVETPGFIPAKSKGHICFMHGYEYLHGDKYVFKADMKNPIECTGNRENAEFICPIKEWNSNRRMGKIFPVKV